MIRALEYDLREKISFEKARRKWPEVITGITLPLGEEPLQSMEKLGRLRNSAIHYTAPLLRQAKILENVHSLQQSKRLRPYTISSMESVGMNQSIRNLLNVTNLDHPRS